MIHPAAHLKDQLQKTDTRQDSILPRVITSYRLTILADTSQRRRITTPDIFIERQFHQRPNIRMVNHSPRASLFLASCALYSASFFRKVSITWAGARDVNFSSSSCRSELAITFSSCSFSFWSRAF